MFSSKDQVLRISWSMILMPFCFSKKPNIAQYEVLKDYVFNKICVKEIISKSNELEKLRLFTLDNILRNKYNKMENLFPSKDVESIWDSNKREEILGENYGK